MFDKGLLDGYDPFTVMIKYVVLGVVNFFLGVLLTFTGLFSLISILLYKLVQYPFFDEQSALFFDYLTAIIFLPPGILSILSSIGLLSKDIDRQKRYAPLAIFILFVIFLIFLIIAFAIAVYVKILSGFSGG